MYPNEPPVFFAKNLDAFLRWAVEVGAQDIIFQTGEAVFLQTIAGQNRVTQRPLTKEEVAAALKHMYGGPSVLGQIKSAKDVDFSYEIKPNAHERYRFRVNAVGIFANGLNGIHLILHSVPSQPPSLNDIAMPPELREALRVKDQGLVLITGGTGNGKTTTLASLMRDRLETDLTARIITYEAPIEYTYETLGKVLGTITQTEVGRHFPSFPAALRNAMRRRPSTLLVGECRDAETINEAVMASFTGHQVFADMHAYSVRDVFARLIRVWSEKERRAHLFDFLCAIKVVAHQRKHSSPQGAPAQFRMTWEYLVVDEATRTNLMDLSPEDIPAWVDHQIEQRGTRLTTTIR